MSNLLWLHLLWIVLFTFNHTIAVVKRQWDKYNLQRALKKRMKEAESNSFQQCIFTNTNRRIGNIEASINMKDSRCAKGFNSRMAAFTATRYKQSTSQGYSLDEYLQQYCMSSFLKE